MYAGSFETRNVYTSSGVCMADENCTNNSRLSVWGSYQDLNREM